MAIEQVRGQGNVPVPSPNVPGGSRAATPALAGGGTGTVTPDLPQKSAPDLKQLQEAVQQVQRAVQSHASSLEFSLDKTTGTTVVRIVDAQSSEVIRQIPSEEMLALAQSIDQQMQHGLLLKQKA
jgi:flagellar protein FlaG